MPEVVIQGQSANAGFARSGGLGLPPGGTVGAPGGEASYAAGVAPWTGDGWVSQSMAGHAARANAGYAVWGAAGGSSLISPMAGASSPSMSFMQPPEMVLTNALANALGRSPLTGSAYGSVLYNLNRMREDDDIIAQRSAAQRSSVDGMWRESFRWGPSSMDAPTMPAPPGGWPVGVPAFLRYQHNARSDGRGVGAGGGGGGGGGGFGGGGGWGRGVPFAGAFGFGATSRLLTGSLTAGVAAAAAEELAFAPQTFGHLEGGAIGAAAPYRNMVFDSYALARAGGFKGENLLGSIYTGVKPPEWMERLGLGPTEALQKLSGFGIVQGSNEANRSLIQGIAGMQFTPAFGGLNLEGSVSQAARYGLVSGNAGGVAQYTQQMAPILAMAVEQGFDRSAVARSIDAAVGSLGASGGGGIGATPGSIGQFIMGYRDLPGGHTGEAGLSAMQQLQSATASVGQDPLRTMTFINASQGMRTETQLKTFLDRTHPGYFDAIKENPITSKMVQNYLAAQQAGDSYSAARWLAQIVGGGGTGGVVGGNPEAEREIFSSSPFVQQLPPYMRPLATGGTGQQPGAYIAGQQAGRQTLGDRSNNPLNMRRNGQEIVYPNLAAGVEAAARQIQRDFSAHGLKTLGALIGDPKWGWAPASDGNDPTGYAARVAKRLGMGVNDSLESVVGDPARMAQLVQAMSQEEVGHAIPEESVVHGVGNAMGAGGMPADYWADRRSEYRTGASPSAPGQNMPPAAALTAYSDALAGAMKGSEISFTEMNVIIPAVNKALAAFAKHLADANQQFTLGRPSQGLPSYLMLPGN